MWDRGRGDNINNESAQGSQLLWMSQDQGKEWGGQVTQQFIILIGFPGGVDRMSSIKRMNTIKPCSVRVLRILLIVAIGCIVFVEGN